MAKGNCASNGLARATARSTSRCRRGLTRVPTSGTDQRRCAGRDRLSDGRPAWMVSWRVAPIIHSRVAGRSFRYFVHRHRSQRVTPPDARHSSSLAASTVPANTASSSIPTS